MTESLTSAHGKLGLLLEGKTVVLVGSRTWQIEQLPAIICREGGQVAAEVTETVDIVVVGRYSRGTPAAVKTAEKLNKKGARIKIIEEQNVYEFLLPDQDSVVRLLRSGDSERFNGLMSLNPERYAYSFTNDTYQISNADLSAAEMQGLSIDFIHFNQTQFGKSNLAELSIASFENCSCEEGRIHKVFFESLSGCSFQRAELQECQLVAAYDCDFSESKSTRLTIENEDGKYSKLSFRSSLLDRFSSATRVKFFDCDFSQSTWQNAAVHEAVFERCNFKNAKLEKSRFVRCQFIECDLSGASFQDCTLPFLVASEVKIDNAEFVRCNMIGASLGALDLRKAKGLQESVDAKKLVDIAKLKSIKELDKVVRSGSYVEIFFDLQGPDGKVPCVLTNSYSHMRVVLNVDLIPEIRRAESLDVKDAYSALEIVAAVYHGYEILPTSIQVKVNRGQNAKDLKAAFIAALYESFGHQPPDEKALKKLESERKAKANKEKAGCLEMLRGGAKGIDSWNKFVEEHASEANLQKVNLSGCDLTGANFTGLTMTGANLENAVMRECLLNNATLNNAKLIGADLSEAQCAELRAESADFTNATLENANLTNANLGESKFCQANLRGADLTEAYLFAANFSGADMAAVDFFDTRYDEKTMLPSSAIGASGLVWCGRGNDPALVKAVLDDVPKTPLEFSSFLERLQVSIDKERLKKAIKMLQAESFSLFAEVKPEYMIGVVKSQTDPDLVYACQLTADGKFCCGTQNLNACGGLRGALCKHLLVLLLGLTKAEELDATVADTWARASKLQVPKMDKDFMSETLLRYKGAEAGEIDWRPTETIPEDYYAF
ncbi:MAG: pentapeptide repeat-containing protein [Candidatus Obscuribacterales bacterium]|nr:pentapeptide repeat-containing protein [Candidatus Obscuribacterales bacterium]